MESETKALALLIDSAIVDPRGPDLQLPRAADDGALAGVAVAHHQPPGVLVDFVLMCFDHYCPVNDSRAGGN